MKLAYYTIICIAFFTNTFGQSISLQPNSLQLPCVASNPACTVADKGKVVFNTNQNKILYCNGSAWIDPESGTGVRITPSFSASNYSGQMITSDLETIEFPDEEFDLNNNFNLQDAPTYANTFVAPDNGIYEFNLNARLDMSGFVPSSTTRLKIGVGKSVNNGGSTTYYEFPVKDYSDQNYIHVSSMLNVTAGNRVVLYVRIVDAPTYGILQLDQIKLTGKLVSWY